MTTFTIPRTGFSPPPKAIQKEVNNDFQISDNEFNKMSPGKKAEYLDWLKANLEKGTPGERAATLQEYTSRLQQAAGTRTGDYGIDAAFARAEAEAAKITADTPIDQITAISLRISKLLAGAQTKLNQNKAINQARGGMSI
jgi:hypothetical protein